MAKAGLGIALAAALGIAALGGCDLAAPEITALDAGSGRPGPLAVVIDHEDARAAVSGPGAGTSYYVIAATGPEGGVSYSTSSEPRATIQAQASGTWTVTAEAYSAEDVLLAKGRKTVRLSAGQTKTITIAVKPIKGLGTLDLTMTWDAVACPLATAEARLDLQGGSVLVLEVTTASGSASSFTGGVPAGRHTLVARLVADGRLVAQRSEAVRILGGAATPVALELAVAAAMEIGLEGDGGPLEIGIAGLVDPLVAGRTMTLTARMAEPLGTAGCTWYLNGLPAAAGGQWTFGSDLAPGVYRVDVTAADGERAGSASATFHVVD